MTKQSGAKSQAVKEPGGFILNSYQTPNDYVDRFLHLYTGEELKVLTYTVRRIFGFQKRQDNISLSQYQHGLFDDHGNRLDHGTGLARGTVIKALASLVKYRLMVFVGSNDPRRDDGDCYALQLDASKVDVAGLLKREEEKREANTRRTDAARRSKGSARRETTHTPSPHKLSDSRSVGQTTAGLSDRPVSESPADPPAAAGSVCATGPTRSVAQTETGLSHRHTITRGNPGEIQNTHTQRDGPAPSRPGCVCRATHGSEFCAAVRLAYARSRPQSINNPDGYAYSKRAVAGEFDDAIRAWEEAGRPVEGSAATAKPPDTSGCPDCHGSGSVFDNPTDPKSHRRCKHPRLVRPPRTAARASP